MEEHTVEITDIKEETYDVKTFRLTKPEGFSFVSGQYCTAYFLDKFVGESRPFTFSNSPTDDHLELTIKKMGDFTSEIHSLKKGDKIKINGPKGETLNFDENIKEDVVFLAGGSGVTPFMSAIRYAIAKDLPNKIVLLFSNRTEKDIIYRDELDRIDSSKIKVVNALSKEESDGWKGETGRIDKEMIEKYVDGTKKKIWYICGPPAMNDAMKAIFDEMGISDEKIRREKWEIPGKHS